TFIVRPRAVATIKCTTDPVSVRQRESGSRSAARQHHTSMHRYLVVILLVPAACGIQLPDPCADTSPLQADPKVKEACEAMAETGGEAGDYVCVTPFAYEDKYSLC